MIHLPVTISKAMTASAHISSSTSLGITRRPASFQWNILSDKRIRVRVDFSGDFEKEIGILEISVNTDQLIVRIDANLE